MSPVEAGPPAGNVPLVAWPSVCTDQEAGAISSDAEHAGERQRPRARPQALGGDRDGAEHADGDEHRRQPPEPAALVVAGP